MGKIAIMWGRKHRSEALQKCVDEFLILGFLGGHLAFFYSDSVDIDKNCGEQDRSVTCSKGPHLESMNVVNMVYTRYRSPRPLTKSFYFYLALISEIEQILVIMNSFLIGSSETTI